jgi:uncharacterized protein involved in exopolysaccharide biosynthesis
MNDSSEPVSTELSLVAIWRFFRRNLLIIGASIVVCGGLTTALSFYVTPRYRAEVTFSPAGGSGGLSGDLGNLGGLAAIAGINLGGVGKKSEEALEYLRSGGFTREFIQRHNLLPVLYANKWDAAHQQWKGEPPTLAQGVKRFSNKVRQIAEDRRTGIVTLSIVWSNRNMAAEWANELISEADAALRQRGIAELDRSIAYLKAESAETSTFEIQSAVFKVMESELKDQMVARTRDSYAFKVLDPAVPPDPKEVDSPNKVMYLVLGSGLGLLLGIIVASSRKREPSRT